MNDKNDARDALSHPMQPTGSDSQGVLRFKENQIVRFLLDCGGYDLNKLCVIGNNRGWTDDDWTQFAQLIGYSVSGWADLSYVSDVAYDRVDSGSGPTDEMTALRNRVASLEGAIRAMVDMGRGHVKDQ